MPFTTTQKSQLWDIFSRDTDDLDPGSGFMQAIMHFENKDTEYPEYGLVAGIQTTLVKITELKPQVEAAQTASGLTTETVVDHYTREYSDKASNQILGTALQLKGLIQGIRDKLKLDDYMFNKRKSRLLGVRPMYAYRHYGRSHLR